MSEGKVYVQVDSLIINITDLCNMNCKFCLRGDFSGRKMDLSLIPKIFDGISSIGSITITGGEPAMYEEAITAIVDYIEKSDIDVNGFYIVTNGKVYSQVIVDCVKRVLFRYISANYKGRQIVEKIKGGYKLDTNVEVPLNMDDEMYAFGVSVSLDKYHDPISVENYLKYRYSGIYSHSKEQEDVYVLARGRGENIPGARARAIREIYIEADEDYITTEELYVTIGGKVFADCDISYEMEEMYEPYGDLTQETLLDVILREAERSLEEEE